MPADGKMITLNAIDLVELCKLFLSAMYKRRMGKILNVASTGAFQPGPYAAAYYASKAFVLSYSRAIRYEAKKHGVTVCAVCPGATRTKFFDNEGVETPAFATAADSVAAKAYCQRIHNKSILIPGLQNKLMNVFPLYIKIANVKREAHCYQYSF